MIQAASLPERFFYCGIQYKVAGLFQAIRGKRKAGQLCKGIVLKKIPTGIE